VSSFVGPKSIPPVYTGARMTKITVRRDQMRANLSHLRKTASEMKKRKREMIKRENE